MVCVQCAGIVQNISTSTDVTVADGNTALLDNVIYQATLDFAEQTTDLTSLSIADGSVFKGTIVYPNVSNTLSVVDLTSNMSGWQPGDVSALAASNTYTLTFGNGQSQISSSADIDFTQTQYNFFSQIDLTAGVSYAGKLTLASADTLKLSGGILSSASTIAVVDGVTIDVNYAYSVDKPLLIALTDSSNVLANDGSDGTTIDINLNSVADVYLSVSSKDSKSNGYVEALNINGGRIMSFNSVNTPLQGTDITISSVADGNNPDADVASFATIYADNAKLIFAGTVLPAVSFLSGSNNMLQLTNTAAVSIAGGVQFGAGGFANTIYQANANTSAVFAGASTQGFANTEVSFASGAAQTILASVLASTSGANNTVVINGMQVASLTNSSVAAGVRSLKATSGTLPSLTFSTASQSVSLLNVGSDLYLKGDINVAAGSSNPTSLTVSGDSIPVISFVGDAATQLTVDFRESSADYIFNASGFSLENISAAAAYATYIVPENNTVAVYSKNSTAWLEARAANYDKIVDNVLDQFNKGRGFSSYNAYLKGDAGSAYADYKTLYTGLSYSDVLSLCSVNSAKVLLGSQYSSFSSGMVYADVYNLYAAVEHSIYPQIDLGMTFSSGLNILVDNTRTAKYTDYLLTAYAKRFGIYTSGAMHLDALLSASWLIQPGFTFKDVRYKSNDLVKLKPELALHIPMPSLAANVTMGLSYAHLLNGVNQAFQLGDYTHSSYTLAHEQRLQAKLVMGKDISKYSSVNLQAAIDNNKQYAWGLSWYYRT